MSVSELLEVIATTPRHFYLPGTNLSSYSLSASQYLEAVPSCESLRARLTVASDTKTNAFVTAFESDGDVLATHLALADVGATAAQSATNVWMMRVVADLRASQGDVMAAAALRSAADSLLDELVAGSLFLANRVVRAPPVVILDVCTRTPRLGWSRRGVFSTTSTSACAAAAGRLTRAGCHALSRQICRRLRGASSRQEIGCERSRLTTHCGMSGGQIRVRPVLSRPGQRMRQSPLARWATGPVLCQ